jgi:hypothetical protein
MEIRQHPTVQQFYAIHPQGRMTSGLLGLTIQRSHPRERMETTVTPLTTFADRASAVEARLKRHQEEKALALDAQS